MIEYKSELEQNRAEILENFNEYINHDEKPEAEESSNDEDNFYKEKDLDESFQFILDSTTDIKLKNESLKRIAHITKIHHENVFSKLTTDILQSILFLVLQQETCLNAFNSLCIITYFTDDFNEIIIDSDLFIFISENIQYFNEKQFYKCVILLYNLFTVIPLQKPLDVNLIENLINFDVSKIIQVPKVISLFYIIMDNKDFPDDYVHLIFNTFRNVLCQPFKFDAKTENLQKTKKNVFKKLDLLLDDERYQKKAISFINNNDIVRPLIAEMNDSNSVCCLSIILKMLLKDDTFNPQLQAFGFENKLIQLCSNEIENIQHEAIHCSIAYMKIFPNFSQKFSQFDFEDIFIVTKFEIKVALNELYINIFDISINKGIDFTLKLSKQFFLIELDMIDSGDDFVKSDVYHLLVLFLTYNNHFIFDFDALSECSSDIIMNMAEDDHLSKDTELSKWSLHFLQVIKKAKISCENSE